MGLRTENSGNQIQLFPSDRRAIQMAKWYKMPVQTGACFDSITKIGRSTVAHGPLETVSCKGGDIRLVRSKLKAERRHLRPLPPAPIPDYASYRCRVRRWSTTRVANRTYSVPPRLIGTEVDGGAYADHIEVYYKDHLVESMERLHGAGEAQIDYRHIIVSLVRSHATASESR